MRTFRGGVAKSASSMESDAADQGFRTLESSIILRGEARFYAAREVLERGVQDGTEELDRRRTR